MNLRTTFQSIIALHQEEFPYALIPRDLSLPIDSKKEIDEWLSEHGLREKN